MSSVENLPLDAELAYERLKKRIYILNTRIWENRIKWDAVEEWLNNFTGEIIDIETERLHALYILSQFMYFGSKEIRILLRSLYRDLFLLPLIQEVRISLGNTRDTKIIHSELMHQLDLTRFMGVGNPAESGVHLLYYFRQENGLSVANFSDIGQIFTRDTENKRILRDNTIKRYVFIDDFCGSGITAEHYSTDFLLDLLTLDEDIKIFYYALFGTASGLRHVRDKSLFHSNCAAVFELDQSYRFLDSSSRYFPSNLTTLGIDPELIKKITLHYGSKVWPQQPSGFADSQCLLGFHHNTPDNTLPIIWQHKIHGCPVSWKPAFKRYPKL